MNRPSLDLYLMSIALEVAKRSTCSRHFAVGAVATKDGRILMTAYNGVPSGVSHCDDVGCVRGEDGKHLYLLHAEENLVSQACKYGVNLDRSTVYVTHFPCTHCAALLIQAGVSRVIFAGYSDELFLHVGMMLFEQAGVECYQYSWMKGALMGLENVLKEVRDENSEQANRATGLVNPGPKEGDSSCGEDDLLVNGCE